MTVTINAQFDCTQRQFVVDLARVVYAAMGYKLPNEIEYLFDSQHPQEKAALLAAEEIFEMLTGDSPSYDDDDEEGDRHD